MWNLQTGEQLAPLTKHSHSVNGLASSKDGRFLAVGCGEGNSAELKVWDMFSRKVAKHLYGQRASVLGVAFSPDESMLASTDIEKGGIVGDLNSGKQITSFAMPQGDWVATGSSNGSIRLVKIPPRNGNETPHK